MGLDTYLKGLVQAVLGNASPQPQAPPVPQQPQGGASSPSTAAPQSGGFMQGASSFLGNPLTQAALSGYFNAIGQPKINGPLAKVSAGGLGALGAYNAAEAAQAQGPINAAKLAQMQQQNQLTGAQTGLTQQKTQQLAGIGTANAALAAQIHSAIPTMNSTQAQRATLLANTIATDTSKVYDPEKAFAAIYQEPLKEAQLQAQTSETGARQKLTEAQAGAIPSEVALRGAEAGAIPSEVALRTAEAGAIPAKTKLTEAETAAIPERLKMEGERVASVGSGKDIADWYDPISDQQYRGAQRHPTDRLVSTRPKTTTPKPADPIVTLTKLRALYDKSGGAEYFASARGVPSFERFTASHGVDPTTGAALPPIEPGWHYDYDDASRMPIAIDASGVPHRYEP